MARRKNNSEESEGAPEWMTTYSDLVTLLLTFFILLFSMAIIDVQKFNEISFSLRSSFMHKANGEQLNTNKGQSIITVNFVNPDDTGKLRVDNNKYKDVAQDVIVDSDEEIQKEKISKAKQDFIEKIKDMGLEDYVEVIDEKNVLITRIDAQILFTSGSAEILEEGKNVLNKLGPTFKALENDIMVKGHTDNVPIDTLIFPSNWELSAKRSINVVKYFQEVVGIDPIRLEATANSEYKNIEDNSTDEGRSKNRRIEIVIIK